MKKSILFVSILVVNLWPLFPADADVLPPGESRYTLSAGFFNATNFWDNFGKPEQYLATARLLTAGGKLEYGLAPLLSISLSWLPGGPLWSEARITGPLGSLTVSDPSDVSLAFRIPVIGSSGFFQLPDLRLAAEPFIIFAWTETDWTAEATRRDLGKPYLVSKAERHVPAVGARVHCDWQFLESFTLYAWLSYAFFFAADQVNELFAQTSTDTRFSRPVWYGGETAQHTDLGYRLFSDNAWSMATGLAYEFKYAPASKINGAKSIYRENGYSKFDLLPYADFIFSFKEPKLDLGLRLDLGIPVTGVAQFQIWSAQASISARFKQ